MAQSTASVDESPASAADTSDTAWWARGDAPVRTADALVPLVDGRTAMLAMCVAFLSARHSIWLADWDIHVNLQMVRGRDLRAGPDGSPEQQALLDRLRAAGLDDGALALWQSGRLRVGDVLGCAARRGVAVRVLLWGPFDPLGLVHIINDPHQQRRRLERQGATCRLDKSSRSPFHVAQALHQKCAVIDGQLAFVGGVDLTVELGGDFDRWDVSVHPFSGHVRGSDLGSSPHPWHDAHLFLTGAPAHDVERNIHERWDEAAAGTMWPHLVPPLRHLVRRLRSGSAQRNITALSQEPPGCVTPQDAHELAGPAARVQVVRTIPSLTYRFAPEGIHGIAQAYVAAIRQARQFIYLESQYLWLETYKGLDIWRLGWPSHHMRELLHELAEAAERGVEIGIVLPDHPNAGRDFTTQTLAWLRHNAPHADAAQRLHSFTLATSARRASTGETRYRPVYVHAKVGIVDDRWATIGSANLNSRGVSHDAEINVAVLDSAFARGLRRTLWDEHAGLCPHATTGWPDPAGIPLLAPQEIPDARGLLGLVHPLERLPGTPDEQRDAETLDDPRAGLALLARRARENLDRMCRGEPLVGQLLPYLDEQDAHRLGVHLDRKRGVLDQLRANREHVQVRHTGKYI